MHYFFFFLVLQNVVDSFVFVALVVSYGYIVRWRNCFKAGGPERNLEWRRLKLMYAWQLRTMTGKGRLLTDGTNYARWFRLLQVRAVHNWHSYRFSSYDFSVKFSPCVCVVVVAALTGEMTTICQHVWSPISGENNTAWLHQVLLTTLMEQQTVTNPAVMHDLCAMTKL